MKYLIDANIIILSLGGANEQLRQRMSECDEGEVVTSSIAYAEVALGSAAGKPPPPERLRAFGEEVPVLSFDFKAARAYASLTFKRGSFDRLIGAHALSHDLTVVTDNVAHFTDIPGLRVENWVTA